MLSIFKCCSECPMFHGKADVSSSLNHQRNLYFQTNCYIKLGGRLQRVKIFHICLFTPVESVYFDQHRYFQSKTFPKSKWAINQMQLKKTICFCFDLLNIKVFKQQFLKNHSCGKTYPIHSPLVFCPPLYRYNYHMKLWIPVDTFTTVFNDAFISYNTSLLPSLLTQVNLSISFTQKSNTRGGRTRWRCKGKPTDLLCINLHLSESHCNAPTDTGHTDRNRVERLNLRGGKVSKCSVFSTAFNEGLLSGPACCGAPNTVMTRSLNHPAADIQLCCAKVTWKYVLLRHQPHKQLGEMQANVRVPSRLHRKMGRK